MVVRPVVAIYLWSWPDRSQLAVRPLDATGHDQLHDLTTQTGRATGLPLRIKRRSIKTHFTPSLISLTVSVDVKRYVYLPTLLYPVYI